MALIVKEDEPLHPVHIGFLGLVTIVPKAEDVTDLVEQIRFPGFKRNRRTVKIRGCVCREGVGKNEPGVLTRRDWSSDPRW
jgi:hypothetical protein